MMVTMAAVALALGASLMWGVSDFAAGLHSRRGALWALLLVSQGCGLVLFAVSLLVLGGALPHGDRLAASVLAGVAGVVALAAFYRSLALGPMGVVAPVAALGAAVPVVAGVLQGERPPPAQAAGLALALVGVLLVSRARPEAPDPAWRVGRAVGLALVAALAAGAYFVLIDHAAEGGVVGTLLVERATVTALLLAAAGPALRQLSGAASSLAPMAAIGTLDAVATVLYAAATTEGALALVGVVGSLYPVATILLARGALGERLTPLQAGGAAGALGGVALIAAG